MLFGRHVGKKMGLLITGAPLAGALCLSLFPISPWMHQALIGVTLLWMYAMLITGVLR